MLRSTVFCPFGDFYNLHIKGNVVQLHPMDDQINILIVDDEPEARELLQYIIQGEPGLNITGLAENVDEAFEFLKKDQPDLVFLDIQMPEKDGFKFIEQVHQAGYYPGIVFVTAYEHYAIQAIRNSVFDYILKPIRREELIDAIGRFRNRTRKDEKQDLSQLLLALKESGPGKIKLNTRSGYILINPHELIYCQADGNYTFLQLVNGNRELSTLNLSAIEENFKGGGFFRVSRSYLVNLRYLSRVDRKNCSCVLEYQGDAYSIRIPAQKIKVLEANFS